MKKKKLFYFNEFIEDYASTQEKEDDIKTYMVKYNINRNTPIEEHPFYEDYLSKFKIDWVLAVPENVQMDEREKNLLIRLVLGSFSSSYTLSLSDDWKRNPTETVQVELRISVAVEDKYVSKSVSELWSFQIQRLFYIYINEQISLLMAVDDEEEMEEYKNEQQTKLQKYESKMKDVLEEAELFPCLEKILY